jgi:hypothetical protein
LSERPTTELKLLNSRGWFLLSIFVHCLPFLEGFYQKNAIFAS